MYTRHNLGPLPNAPFSDDVALNLTNRLKSRLVDLDKDLQDKKVTPPPPLDIPFLYLCAYVKHKLYMQVKDFKAFLVHLKTEITLHEIFEALRHELDLSVISDIK
jgi:hypothetical protein